jgi:hypothetical protein
MRLQKSHWLIALIIVVVGLLGACGEATGTVGMSSAPLLPGEVLWSGVPSYLFGSNDPYNYAGPDGFNHQASMQAAVKAAHIPLIRGWFEQVDETDHKTPITDARQLLIVNAIHNAGGVCLANLTQPATEAFDLHLVSLLKGKCELYEVMNEPDLSGVWPPAVSESNYLAFWNSFVPKARALDPNAKFGGPTTAIESGMNGTYMRTILDGMKTSGVLPDFITFHWYTCYSETAAQCLAETEPWFASIGKTLVSWVRQDFPGKATPVGLTEWNANAAGGGYMNNDAWMAQYMRAALTGLEANHYLSFATQYDLGSYSCYGSCDLFNIYATPTAAAGTPRPEFTTLAGEIARLRSGAPTPTSPSATSHALDPVDVPALGHIVPSSRRTGREALSSKTRAGSSSTALSALRKRWRPATSYFVAFTYGFLLLSNAFPERRFSNQWWA